MAVGPPKPARNRGLQATREQEASPGGNEEQSPFAGTIVCSMYPPSGADATTVPIAVHAIARPHDRPAMVAITVSRWTPTAPCGPTRPALWGPAWRTLLCEAATSC